MGPRHRCSREPPPGTRHQVTRENDTKKHVQEVEGGGGDVEVILENVGEVGEVDDFEELEDSQQSQGFH